MKNKKMIFGLIFLISMANLISGTIFLVQPVMANDSLISTIADKDSYVDLYSPTSNYGGQDWLIFGDFISWNEAYLHFNFSDKPTDWTKAEISIDMYSISETFSITVSLIKEDWDEYTINWVNKPIHGEIITTFTVAEGKVYTIDVSNYIEGNGISICINASDYLQTGYVQASSREGYWSFVPEDVPQLIWTYPEPEPEPEPEPTIDGIGFGFGFIIGIILICGGVILFISVPTGIYLILRKRKRNKD